MRSPGPSLCPLLNGRDFRDVKLRSRSTPSVEVGRGRVYRGECGQRRVCLGAGGGVTGAGGWGGVLESEEKTRSRNFRVKFSTICLL